MKPNMSLMVGTKMTKALVLPSRPTVMMVWRIQLNSLDLDRCWLMEVRIYREIKERLSDMTHSILQTKIVRSELDFFDTYREEHHRNSEGDGSQHSQADDQQDHIKLVEFGVGVQQLGLHMHCKERQQRPFRAEVLKV